MEVTGKTFGIEITLDELINFMTNEEWERIEKKVLSKAKETYNEAFTDIDLWEKEGKLVFGVSS